MSESRGVVDWAEGRERLRGVRQWVRGLRSPIDAADAAVLGRVAVYSLFLVWVALVVGLAVRIFLAVAFG